MVLTIACANTDGHARNHAFILHNGFAGFAPIYDVAPTVFFSATRRTGLRVCGQDIIDRVTAAHLTLEARSWGLRGAGAVVTDTLERLAGNVADAHRSVPAVDPAIVTDVERRIATIRTR